MVKSEIQQVKLRFGIIGNNEALARGIDIAMQVAPTDLSVLITGESGVGKESVLLIRSFSGMKKEPLQEQSVSVRGILARRMGGQFSWMRSENCPCPHKQDCFVCSKVVNSLRSVHPRLKRQMSALLPLPMST